ncbi:hypothetical protein BC835DRAFT_253107 [Cytidiella melzeri]|nr:hypothetical protein BC835DRAFT_253107 [Cytidiella melzeri]
MRFSTFLLFFATVGTFLAVNGFAIPFRSALSSRPALVPYSKEYNQRVGSTGAPKPLSMSEVKTSIQALSMLPTTTYNSICKDVMRAMRQDRNIDLPYPQKHMQNVFRYIQLFSQ